MISSSAGGEGELAGGFSSSIGVTPRPASSQSIRARCSPDPRSCGRRAEGLCRRAGARGAALRSRASMCGSSAASCWSRSVPRFGLIVLRRNVRTDPFDRRIHARGASVANASMGSFVRLSWIVARSSDRIGGNALVSGVFLRRVYVCINEIRHAPAFVGDGLSPVQCR